MRHCPSMEWDRYCDLMEPVPQPRCEHCGRFLKYEPDTVEWWESEYEYEDLDGKMCKEIHGGNTLVWNCKCGEKSRVDE